MKRGPRRETAPAAGPDELVSAVMPLVSVSRRDQSEQHVRALVETERRRWLARAEQLWLRRFGWSLMRPLLATGVVAALALLAWDRRRAGALLAPLLAGAAIFYVVLQIYVVRWLMRAERREAAAREEREAAAERLARAAQRDDHA